MPVPAANVEAEFRRFQKRSPGTGRGSRSRERWATPGERELTVKQIIYALKYFRVTSADIASLTGASKPFVERVRRITGLKPGEKIRTARALALMRGGREFKRVAQKSKMTLSHLSELAKKEGIENPRRLPLWVKRELTARLLQGERPSMAMARDLKISIQSVYRYKTELERILLKNENYEAWLRLRWNSRVPARELFPDEESHRLYRALPWKERRALREVLILQRMESRYVEDAGEKWILRNRLKASRTQFEELRRGSGRAP